MAMLLQFRVEYTGWVGLIVGLIIFTGILIGTLKGAHWLWTTVIRPAKDRWKERRSIKKALAFAEFEIEWLLDQGVRPVFILDEDKRCTFASESLCRMLQVDSSDLEGRSWYARVTESELSRVIEKWEQAYKHQTRYTNVTTLVIGRQKVKFLVTAEPFLWNSKVARYIGTLEPMDEISEPRQLGT
jgi:PAS domain-containing protein